MSENSNSLKQILWLINYKVV